MQQPGPAATDTVPPGAGNENTPQGETAPLKIGLINNPLSRSNRERGLVRIESLAGMNGVPQAEVEMKGDDIRAALERFAEDGVNVLAINGGDGTVQEILTLLYGECLFEAPPALAVLRGGRSNVIASDCGLWGPPAEAFARLLKSAESGTLGRHVVERQVMRVDGVKGSGPQYGMLFAAAGATAIVDYSRSRVDRLGLPGWVSDALMVAAFVTRPLRHPGQRYGLKGYHVAGETDGLALPFPRVSLMLAVTLDSAVLRTRPYWNTQSGPIRLTMMSDPVRGALRSLPRLLYGGETRNLPADRYFSRGVHEATIAFDGRFILDGEFFEAGTSTPLRLTSRDTARFISL